MKTRFNNTFAYKLIYVFRINDTVHEGMVKIGEATVEGRLDKSLLSDNSENLIKAAKKRINQYTKTAGIRYELLYTTLAISDLGKGFSDHDVHTVLKRSGKGKICFDVSKRANEWFQIDLETAKKAINAVKSGKNALGSGEITENINPIVFRPEQKIAIEQTKKQFSVKGVVKSGQARMLWNAKMRFGKTLSSLQVVKELNFKRTIIATHRPVVSDGWFEDFVKIFYDREDYKFGSRTKGATLKELFKFANEGGNFVYFASIQDLRGSNLVGGKIDKNNELFAYDWDCLIIDEAHEGTQTKLGDDVIRNLIKENTKTLYLSGTPFNLINDYKDSEVFTWDYVMEQRAKLEWIEKHFGDSNPYEGLPRLNIYTYDIAKDIPGFEDIEDSAFNFREFFRTWTGDLEIDKKPVPSGVKIGHFVYADEVNSFLNLLVKEGEHNYPFSNEEYRDNFRHTLWMLPGVKAAKALSSLLKKHPVFGSGAFEIVNVAGEGDEEDEREEALKKLRKAITHKPDETRTITLSCGRLTTGVTIDAWTACFMLSGSSSTSASSYLQTIFRVQSPANIGGKMKTECYVFDFAPDRTLKMVAEAGNLSIKAGAISDRKLMGEFLNFCPVIGISGSTMTAYSTEQMLAQLKRAMIDRVARNGFDDTRLYSEKLLKLTDDEIEMFQNLKKILGTSKANRSTHDIVVNDTGLDAELYEFEDEDGDEKPKKKLTDEEMARKKELMELRKKRSAAISILRGIAIRIPLLVYGADIEDEEKGIDVENFTKLIDDASWVEFMPKGVTKPLFEQFTKYFDSDVFIEAGKLIRKKTKASEELPITERIKAITDIFSTFKNPDKETVLTPWRVVNMHLGNCIGGYNFFDEIYERQIDILGNNDPREVIYKSVSEKIFVADTKVLDINSKTGLYPLYIAYSIFNLLKNKHGKTKKSEDLWAEVLKKNIFAVCKTKMAAAITRRTLCGFNNYTTNILIYEDIVSDMKDDAAERVKKTGAASKTVSKISNPKKWNLAGGLGEMKFNAIVGNPPYQEMGGSGGSNDSPIYQYFVTMARELKPSIVSLIIPSRWYSGGRENLLGDFREAMLNDKGLYTIVDYPTASEVFSNVEIKGGICFFGIDTAKNDGKCRFIIIQNGVVTDDSIRDFSGQEYLIRHKTHQDVVKLVNEGGNSATRYLNTIVSSDTPFGIPSNPRTSKKNPMTVHEERQKPSDLFLYHIENLKRKVEFIDRALITKNVDDIDKYKVFIVQSAETGDIRGKILGGIELAPQNSVCSQSYLYVPFNSEIERDNFAKYYKTKFLRFLVSALKTTQSATNKFYAYVPEQDFSEKSDINWTKPINEIDKQLHAKYKLTADQINYIEKMITEMK